MNILLQQNPCNADLIQKPKLLTILSSFDSLPDCAGVPISIGCATTGRSRASIYRDIHAGRIEAFKINASTRLRVGSLRKILAATSLI
ncbi:MAG: transcriptional regulator [Pseudomonadota bacterium]